MSLFLEKKGHEFDPCRCSKVYFNSLPAAVNFVV